MKLVHAAAILACTGIGGPVKALFMATGRVLFMVCSFVRLVSRPPDSGGWCTSGAVVGRDTWSDVQTVITILALLDGSERLQRLAGDQRSHASLDEPAQRADPASTSAAVGDERAGRCQS